MIRHGQSEWNALHKWQGTADTPLTELGRSQARDAGGALAKHPAVAEASTVDVWSSSLRRAVETASLLAESLGVDPPGGSRRDARLVETHAGPWEGLTPDEIEAGWPGYLESGQRPDGFEPLASVVGRVHAALHDIAAVTAGIAVVVGHSGVIRTLLRTAGVAEQSIPNLTGWCLDVNTDGVIPIQPFRP